eukprot:SAG11_NODE_6751_length_1254_cov_1.196537_1_plen_25_part_10
MLATMLATMLASAANTVIRVDILAT